MFDKAIIDTDRFMDLSMSSKALYFLLGMEADDEGFVSYKKVMRIHGGNEDDIKVLVAKNFIIMFKSGVVVITDWQKNNWLDTRRIKPTEYTTEKKLLTVTSQKTYSLSGCLADASPEERRVEESRGEQYRGEESRVALRASTPSQVAKEFFSDEADHEELIKFFSSKGASEEAIKQDLQKFKLYWTEPNRSGTKERWQMQKTFEIKRRLVTWFSRMGNGRHNNNQPKGITL